MYKTPKKKSFLSRMFNTVRMREEEEKYEDEYFDDEHAGQEVEGDENYKINEYGKEHDEEIQPEEIEGELGIDMYQTHNAIVIQAITAGVKLSDIDIDLTREHVAIRGSRSQSHRVTGEDFFNQEIYWGSFSRDVMLPVEVDIDQAEAVEDHGLLTITLPKLNKDRRTVIKVKSI